MPATNGRISYETIQTWLSAIGIKVESQLLKGFMDSSEDAIENVVFSVFEAYLNPINTVAVLKWVSEEIQEPVVDFTRSWMDGNVLIKFLSRVLECNLSIEKDGTFIKEKKIDLFLENAYKRWNIPKILSSTDILSGNYGNHLFLFLGFLKKKIQTKKGMYFPKRKNDLLPISNSDVIVRNIVLIGDTGAGKSTLGNYLINLNQNPTKIFSEGFTVDPHTKDLQMENFIISSDNQKYQINFIDTPGLQDFDDFKNMRLLHEYLRKIREVHGVILVKKHTDKFSEPFKATLRYYRDLFYPVFQERNVFLILSHMDKDTFKDLLSGEGGNTLTKKIEDNSQACKKELNVDVGMIEVINSKLPQRYYTRVVNTFGQVLHGGATFLKDAFNLNFRHDRPSTSIYEHSVMVRDRILRLCTQFSACNMQDQLFPLPPKIDNGRKAALAINKQGFKQMVRTLRGENETKASILSRLGDLEKSKVEITTKIREIEILIDRLRDTVKSPDIYKHGDDMVYFGRITNELLAVPFDINDDFVIKYHSWNAHYKKKERLDQAVKIDLIPDILNFKKDSGFRWYIRVWAEYSGEISNSEKIATEQESLAVYLNKLEDLEIRKTEFEKKKQAVLSEITGHTKDKKNYDKQNKLLSRKLFYAKELPKLVKYIADSGFDINSQ